MSRVEADLKMLNITRLYPDFSKTQEILDRIPDEDRHDTPLIPLFLTELSENATVVYASLWQGDRLKEIKMSKKKLILMLMLLSVVAFTQWNHPRSVWAEICEIPPQPPSVTQRLESRDFPSIVQSWDDMIEPSNTMPINPWESKENWTIYTERLTLHDLHFSPFFSLWWHQTDENPYYGLSNQLAGDLKRAKKVRQERLHQNPNMVFLVEVRLHNHFKVEALPPNSEFWLRNAEGRNIKNSVAWNEYTLDILNTELQQLLIDRIVGIAECGLFDGVLLDGFFQQGASYYRDLNIGTDEEIIEAHAAVLRGVRERVRDEFLILINANDTKSPRYTEYVNGSFMEIYRPPTYRYSYEDLQHLEDVLLWNEKHLRSPQINSLRPQGFGEKSPDDPENRRWMRLFTTMTLTHSNGYILYTTGRSEFFNEFDADGMFIPHHEHIWYRFYDAPLGRPIGGNETKGILYETPKSMLIDGLFIREFTNGWAVYNRSGKARRIQLPERVSGWHSGVKDKRWHTIPDLDGEIYLKKIRVPADVNGDGIVNILDLVATANAFGSDSPDINSDGVVNILDLVRIANHF